MGMCGRLRYGGEEDGEKDGLFAVGECSYAGRD